MQSSLQASVQASVQAILKAVSVNRPPRAAADPSSPSPVAPNSINRHPPGSKLTLHSQQFKTSLQGTDSDGEVSDVDHDSSETSRQTHRSVSPNQIEPQVEEDLEGEGALEDAPGGKSSSQPIDNDGLGDGDASTIRTIFKARGEIPLREDTGEFGQAVEPHTGYTGCTSPFLTN